MSRLEKLYYNMSILSENWTDDPEVMAASDRLEEAMGREMFAKYEDEISLCQVESHRDGFIKGFGYAVSLILEGKAVGL